MDLFACVGKIPEHRVAAEPKESEVQAEGRELVKSAGADVMQK